MTGLDALHNGAMTVCSRPVVPPPRHPDDGRRLRRRRLSHRPCSASGTWATTTRTCPHQRGFQEAVYSPRLGHHLGWPTSGRTTTSTAASATTATSKQYQGYCTDVWFDRGDGLDQGSGTRRSEPFFSTCRPTPPHGPHWVPDKYNDALPRASGPAALLRHDRQHRREHGPARRIPHARTACATTRIVIFMNDNGGTAGVPVFNAGMRGRKIDVLRGRPPRPPASSAGRAASCGRPGTLTRLTEVQDLLPTLIDLCGLHANGPAVRRHQPGRRCCAASASRCRTAARRSSSAGWSTRSRARATPACSGNAGDSCRTRSSTTWPRTRPNRRT